MRTQDSGHKRSVTMVKIIKAPVRAICKVLDLYVKGVTNFSNVYNKPLRIMVDVAPDSHGLPRSFTTSRLLDHDQPSEGALVRSISDGAVGDGASTDIKLTKFELYVIQRHCRELQSCALTKGEVRTSCSMGMGKIDEDRASSFRNDNIVLKNKLCIEDVDSFSSKSHSIDDRVSAKRSKFM